VSVFVRGDELGLLRPPRLRTLVLLALVGGEIDPVLFTA
jgi:hypothetical protein